MKLKEAYIKGNNVREKARPARPGRGKLHILMPLRSNTCVSPKKSSTRSASRKRTSKEALEAAGADSRGATTAAVAAATGQEVVAEDAVAEGAGASEYPATVTELAAVVSSASCQGKFVAESLVVLRIGYGAFLFDCIIYK